VTISEEEEPGGERSSKRGAAEGRLNTDPKERCFVWSKASKLRAPPAAIVRKRDEWTATEHQGGRRPFDEKGRLHEERSP